MDKTNFNKENFNHQLIVAGMTALVSKEGYTAREVFKLLDEIKNQTFPALSELEDR